MPFKKAKPTNKGMTVVYSGDSSVVVRKNGTLAWRNNNPGNLVSGPFTKRHGAIGSNQGFAVFPDIGSGRNAQTSLLKTQTYQNRTIAETIEAYAPPNQNPTEKYIHYVTKKMGMSRDKKLSGMTTQELDAFTDAIRRFESTAPGKQYVMPKTMEGLFNLSEDQVNRITVKHRPLKVKNPMRHHTHTTQSSSGRTLKRVGDTVYRIEKGRPDGSFTSRGNKK